MADIFISYARADRDRIEALAAALEAEGFSVWWDRHIAGGADFSQDIERELSCAKAAIVAWSKDSIGSRWVRDEAMTAADAGKLIPVALDGAAAPMGFKQLQLIDLSSWRGGPSPALDDLVRAVKSRLTGEAPARPAPKRASLATRILRPAPLVAIGATALGLIAVAFLVWSPFATPPPEERPQGDVSNGSAPRGAAAASVAPASARSEATAQGGASSSKDAPVASIAVLPFADLSPDGDQAYFSEGVAEEILNVLARVEGLKVASRTSSFQFRNSETGVPLIARELGVRHIVEGSVRKAGSTVRITAQLIDAEADAHLWSQTFDRPLTTDNIFAVQDEIARAIVEALPEGLRSSALATVPARAEDTESVDAYELYLKGRSLFVERGQRNLEGAISALERAVAIDPEFARAYETLSVVYSVAPGWGILDRDYPTLALAAADKALSLNPDLSMPYVARGYATNMTIPEGARWEEAFANFDEALARDPKNATAAFWRGSAYQGLGYFDRAIADYERCLELDPAYENCRRWMAKAYLSAGRVEEAFRLFEQGLEKGLFSQNDQFAAAYAARGERAAALILLAELFDEYKQLIGPIYRSLTESNLGDAERQAGIDALKRLPESDVNQAVPALLLRAYDLIPISDAAESYVWWFRDDPVFLKSERRKELMRAWKLPEHWRKHGFPPQCRPVGEDDFECD